MKKCSKCKKEQPSNQYYIDNSRKDGLCPQCKNCLAKYKVWANMVNRCTNPKHKDYKNYGGRGITVCNGWQTFSGMESFIEAHWVKGLQLDRIDNNKGYNPENCRFVTPSENNSNKRVQGKINLRGVCFHKPRKKYVAQVWIKGKQIYLGTFTNEADAAKAYDRYVIENKLERKLNFKRRR